MSEAYGNSMPAYGTRCTARTAVLPYDGVMRHPLTEGHTGLPEMDCPLITSEHFSRVSREESHDFSHGRSHTFLSYVCCELSVINRALSNIADGRLESQGVS